MVYLHDELKRELGLSVNCKNLQSLYLGDLMRVTFRRTIRHLVLGFLEWVAELLERLERLEFRHIKVVEHVEFVVFENVVPVKLEGLLPARSIVF